MAERPLTDCDAWLASERPDVKLSDVQRAWLDCTLAGGRALWSGDHGEGRALVSDLWHDYVLATHPDGSYRYVMPAVPMKDDELDVSQDLRATLRSRYG